MNEIAFYKNDAVIDDVRVCNPRYYSGGIYIFGDENNNIIVRVKQYDGSYVTKTIYDFTVYLERIVKVDCDTCNIYLLAECGILYSYKYYDSKKKCRV